MSRNVTVIATGTANIASVIAGLRRGGVDPQITSDAAQVAAADRVVLPGVGSFGAAMSNLDHSGVGTVLAQRVEEGRPTLAVCVGLQLLCASSEESLGVAGLGVIRDEVTRFDDGVRVPQIGWNRVEPEPDTRYLKPGWAYFAHSYRLASIPDGWSGATATYGDRFVAGLERGAVLACQFHPELSGSWGAEVLSRWLTETGGES